MANLNEKLEGVVREVSFKVTPHAGQPVNDVRRKLDYSALTLADVLALADATVIIKLQRSLRSQKPEEIKQGNGQLVAVADAGKTPVSPEQAIAQAIAAGMTKEQLLAMFAAAEENKDN